MSSIVILVVKRGRKTFVMAWPVWPMTVLMIVSALCMPPAAYDLHHR